MLLDWQESDLQPKEMLGRIRQLPQYDNIIIVVQAALTDLLIQKEILDAGADRYLAKMDTNPAKLSQIFKQLIKVREG